MSENDRKGGYGNVENVNIFHRSVEKLLKKDTERLKNKSKSLVKGMLNDFFLLEMSF